MVCARRAVAILTGAFLLSPCGKFETHSRHPWLPPHPLPRLFRWVAGRLYPAGMDASTLALLVDVDGVVTDEHARVDSGTIALLLQLADAGAALAFISGRSRRWLETNLMPVLLEHAPPALVDSLSFAAEMGAVRKGRKTGNTWQVSTEHAVPGELREELIPLLPRNHLEELIEWDGTKEATATFESIHRPDLPASVLLRQGSTFRQ